MRLRNLSTSWLLFINKNMIEFVDFFFFFYICTIIMYRSKALIDNSFIICYVNVGLRCANN